MVDSYDKSLLAVAPASMRPQLEERYDSELLRISTLAPTRLQPSTRPLSDKDQCHMTPPPPSSKPRFWRTTRGIIIISLTALVVLGAIIGGALGGTAQIKSTNSSSTNQADQNQSLPDPVSNNTSADKGGQESKESVSLDGSTQATGGVDQEPTAAIVSILSSDFSEPSRTSNHLGNAPAAATPRPGPLAS